MGETVVIYNVGKSPSATQVSHTLITMEPWLSGAGEDVARFHLVYGGFRGGC